MLPLFVPVVLNIRTCWVNLTMWCGTPTCPPQPLLICGRRWMRGYPGHHWSKIAVKMATIIGCALMPPHCAMMGVWPVIFQCELRPPAKKLSKRRRYMAISTLAKPNNAALRCIEGWLSAPAGSLSFHYFKRCRYAGVCVAHYWWQHCCQRWQPKGWVFPVYLYSVWERPPFSVAWSPHFGLNARSHARSRQFYSKRRMSLPGKPVTMCNWTVLMKLAI